jgi:eukaryotic-like serine/threonine-protein kinase
MPDEPNINTQGGAAVSGNVNTGGGNFIGRDQININQTLSREEIQNRRNLSVMRKVVRSFWIDGVLKHSLYQETLIRLNMQDRSDMVDNRPWNIVSQTVGEAGQELRPGTRIIDVFGRMNQLMLILGEPGSGKTTTLLELARDLLDRADNDPALPTPVVFNLSSWALLRPPLAEWLVDELRTRYSIPKDVAQTWVKQNDLLLLLDGLDEVQDEHRVACAQAINSFRQEHIVPLVVCSRVAEYKRLNAHLKLQGATLLEPLTTEQTVTFLTSAGEHLSGLRTALQQDTELQQLAETPLFLSIMVMAYQGDSVSQVNTTDATQTRRKQIIDAYIKRMFVRREVKPLYSPVKTVGWLRWLAGRLKLYGQTTFLVERMQPSWLQSPNRSSFAASALMAMWGPVYGLSFGAVLALIFGLDVGLFGEPVVVLVFVLVSGLLAGLIIGLVGGLADGVCGGFRSIEQTEKSRQIRARLKSSLYGFLIYGLIYVLVYTLVIGLISGLVTGLINGLAIGLLDGLIGGLVVGLQGRYRDIKLVKRSSWSWNKQRVHVRFGLVNGLVVGLVYALIVGLIGGLLVEFSGRLAFRLVMGLVVGLIGGLVDGLISTLALDLDGQSDVPSLVITRVPNQAIRSAQRQALVLALAFWLIGGLVVGLVVGVGLLHGQAKGLANGLVVGLVFGPIGGLVGGADVVVKHYLLRFALWLKGAIPLRYVRFLDYAAERIFLRKVGGGYIFIHRLMMEHFAAMTDQDIERIVAGIPGYGKK